MEHNVFTEWNVYQAKQKEMIQYEKTIGWITDSKVIQLAEEIAHLSAQGKDTQKLENEYKQEMNIMLLRTKMFLGRAGRKAINEGYK